LQFVIFVNSDQNSFQYFVVWSKTNSIQNQSDHRQYNKIKEKNKKNTVIRVPNSI